MTACAWCGAPLEFRGEPAYELYGGQGGSPLVAVCYGVCRPAARPRRGTGRRAARRG